MSLAKTITLNVGYDAAFWKVRSVQIDYFDKTAFIVYNAYKDEDQYDAYPDPPLLRRDLSVVGDDFDTYFGTTDDLITQTQVAIKALVSDLSDATVE